MSRIEFGRRYLICILLIIQLLLVPSCQHGQDGPDLSIYHFRDTRNLVTFVHEAALALEKNGLHGLEQFKRTRELNKKVPYYLYVYDYNGVNLFHGGMAYLEGKNLSEVADKSGKKIFHLLWDALADENNPHSWIHYLWWEPGKFYPVPKSSCHFEVTTPDGKKLIVGAGLDYPQEEKEFIRIAVDGAIQQLVEYGENGFGRISDPLSSFNYREVSVFAFQDDGKIIISPTLHSAQLGMNILDCEDEVGRKPFRQALNILNNEQRAWVVFMARSRYKRPLVKKCLYMRAVEINGKKVYVGAITNLPQPPWT